MSEAPDPLTPRQYLLLRAKPKKLALSGGAR